MSAPQENAQQPRPPGCQPWCNREIHDFPRCEHFTRVTEGQYVCLSQCRGNKPEILIYARDVTDPSTTWGRIDIPIERASSVKQLSRVMRVLGCSEIAAAVESAGSPA